MELGLQGKGVLVTGGTRGIGREITLSLARAGANVVAGFRSDDDAAEALARELDELGVRYATVRADVTDPDEVATLVAAAKDKLGSLDAVVANVGVDGRAPFAELTAPEWHRVLDANLTSSYLVAREAVKHLAPGGAVIMIGGAVATRGMPGMAHHNASKAGISGLVRSLAREFGPTGVRVNAVAPGVIESAPGGGLPAPVREKLAGLTALGRLGRPADVAGVVLFLASELASYLTGVSITADGGI